MEPRKPLGEQVRNAPNPQIAHGMQTLAMQNELERMKKMIEKELAKEVKTWGDADDSLTYIANRMREINDMYEGVEEE